MGIELTRQQQAVVDNRGGDLLVSAAAGSGKTRVLVERLMQRIQQGEDVDRFLVITFTNAAAAELRDRIAAALHARLAQQPNNRHLRRNATLVYQAQICTIDAFCLDFLRQWGHLAGLDPDFRLCDQGTGEELRKQALEEVLEGRYANIQNDPGFQALADSMAGDRDDQTLESVILGIHAKVQSQASPLDWLMDRKADFNLEGETAPEDTPWGKLLLADARELAQYWAGILQGVLSELEDDPVLWNNYGGTLGTTMDGLERVARAQGWDEMAQMLDGVAFERPKAKRGDCDEALKERVKGLREACKKQLEKLKQRFQVTGAEAMEDLRAIAPAMTSLLDVVAEFDRAFTQLKSRYRLIDFADGEHLTAALLTDGEGNPSPLALEWRKRYVEIMVDEYQDTNGVQNAIFDALSQGDNLFLVGDVKQSIYRFRLADPTIFLDKYRRFAPWEEAQPGQGRTIPLSHNFRSRPEVLDATNFVFRNVMTQSVGELDYDEDQALRHGRQDLQPDERYATELCCVDLSALPEQEDKVNKDLVQARLVAARMKELLASALPIGDRSVRPDDMVILLRSPGSTLRWYAAALDEAGIPWSADGGREFFGTTEIAVAISLLQVVDNPRQDVPLLAVLRSPVFAFTPDRLAQLRTGCSGCVYEAVEAGAGRGEEDCVAFLSLLGELRALAAEESSHKLLWYIYQRTDLPAIFAAMPQGAARRANLMALYEEARRFESGGHKGLMAFLLHLTRMAENGLPVPVEGESAGGVRILSIHSSKGLEFPVVFLCGLEHQFNTEDTRSTILFHPELGLGPKRVDRQRMLRYSTIARDGVALRLSQQLIAEEMRLLYVAMTRAEHKLVMFMGVNGRTLKLERLAAQAQCPPPPRQVAGASCMAEWILTPALCREDSGPLWEELGLQRPCSAPQQGYGWDVRLLTPTQEDGARVGQTPEEGQAEVGVELPEGWQEALAWSYPHQVSAQMPSKLTATQLKGRDKDAEAAQDGVEVAPAKPSVTLRRPVFQGQRPLTPAQQGTALHMVMQYLDFARTNTLEEIQEEIARLVARQFITPQQGEAVDGERVLAFFQSPLGQRLVASRQMEREFKFSMLVPAADYYPDAEAGEEVLLQGVVDCWFEEADGTVTVVDFKTDRVTEHTVEARAREYRPQLEAYSRALSQALGLPVGRCVLWFFALGRDVSWQVK
ncbi:MAG TPA: helicase-exonuclease AddAB subunit AddA [Candidatus Enterenecus avicola]|nr:helicase-exonuclease AddAB subunit AddA [Candidatus Enterenecus avicola]